MKSPAEQRYDQADSALRAATRAADAAYSAACTDWQSAQRAEIIHREAMRVARAACVRTVLGARRER